IRLVDNAFIIIGHMVKDANKDVRRQAVESMGLMKGVENVKRITQWYSMDIWHQQPERSTNQLIDSQKDIDYPPLYFGAGVLIHCTSAGSFAHGLEDSNSIVRTSTVRAVVQQCLMSPYFSCCVCKMLLSVACAEDVHNINSVIVMLAGLIIAQSQARKLSFELLILDYFKSKN
ncbi:MAG: hypothetical protein EZS28_009998, partial [Streblomastix strix]